jgi:hypothetical protein
MLHLDSSLGAGTEIGGVLPTLQAFFLLQQMILSRYARVDAHMTRALQNYKVVPP